MRGILILSIAACLGCQSKTAAPDAAAAPVPGRLEVRWGDSGATWFSAIGEAHWCVRDTLLEILAVSHDSAIGLALYARDSLRVEALPVFRGDLFAPSRPQATVAARVASAMGIQAFQSTGGQVQVTEREGGRVSGTLDLHLRLSTGADSLHLTGRFTRLPVRPAPAWCGRANKPPPR